MIKKGFGLVLFLFLAFFLIMPSASAAVRLPASLKAPFNVNVEAQSAELIISWENPSGIPELSDELYKSFHGYIRVLIDWRLNEGPWHFPKPIPDGQFLSNYYLAAAPHFLASVYEPADNSTRYSSTSINKLVFNIPYDMNISTWLNSNKLEFRLRYVLDYFDESTMTTRYIHSPFSNVTVVGTFKGNNNPSDKNDSSEPEQLPEKPPESPEPPEPIDFESPVEPETLDSAAFKNASNWAVEELNQAEEYGLITEKILGDMRMNITREEFTELVVRLYEIYKETPIEVGAVTFGDTDNPEILKAATLNLVEGTGNNEFSPHKNISRQEMATILYRALRKINSSEDNTISEIWPYTDHHMIEPWAIDGVYYCTNAGIIIGTGINTFDPQSTATREQAVLVCKRAYEFLKIIDSETVEMLEENSEDIGEPTA